MKNSPRVALSVLFLAGLSLLAGCCANNTCDCQDLQADSVFIRLNLDPAQGQAFSQAEIDTVYLLRYVRTKTRAGIFNPPPTRASDSVSLVRATGWSNTPLQQVRTTARPHNPPTLIAALNDGSVIVINNTSPFPASGPTRKLSDFSYALLVAPNRRGPRFAFRLDSVQLSGQYRGDGCCTCYENTRKVVFQAGRSRDVAETGGVPRPLLFVKP